MIPSCWETTTIGELFDITHGKSVTPLARIGVNQVPFLRTSNVFWGKIDLTDLDRMDFTETEVDRMSLCDGDMLVCEGGAIGRTAVWKHGTKRCAFQNPLHRLRAKDRKSDPFFYMYWLQAGFTLNGFYDGVGNRTTIPNLSRSRLAALEVPRPAIAEQRHIASILGKIQQAIEVETDLIRVSRELKAAVMKKLFTEGLNEEAQKKTEIGLVPEGWSVYSMEELREFLQYGTSEKCHLVKNGSPVLRIPNVIGGKIDIEELKYLDAGPKSTENFSLLPGDLLFVRTNGQRAFVGRCAVYDGIPEFALFASYLIRARLKTDLISPHFLQLFAETEQGRAQLSGRAHNAADGKFNINTKTIDSVIVPLPTLKEQLSIVKILDSLESASTVHEHKLSTLQELFSTTLVRLMSASIRVTDLNIDTTCLESQGAAA